MGHPPETIIAERAVTILQRGATSTRWRDFAGLRVAVPQPELQRGNCCEGRSRRWRNIAGSNSAPSESAPRP
jgi:hypothetical protein